MLLCTCSTNKVSAFTSQHVRVSVPVSTKQPPHMAVQQVNVDHQRTSMPVDLTLQMANGNVGFSLPDFRSLLLATSSTDEKAGQLGTNKESFLQSLDNNYTLNQASKERTSLLNKMISEKITTENLNKKTNGETDGSEVPTLSLMNPGSEYASVAPGLWKVVYAPHMTTISGLFGGSFDVQYRLFEDGQMTSHAKYDFPIVGEGFLSVSGSYGSVDDSVSRVDFDRAWVKPLGKSDTEKVPYESLEDVPDSFIKDVINKVGKLMFVDAVAVFPVSFLDDDTIVFDFELLGTRICARKI